MSMSPSGVFPTEIWGHIFAKFDDELPVDIDWSSYGVREPNFLPWELAAIQNLRLVCRIFNYFASPFLCPILRLGISYESIDRANELLRNPRIAGGLRGIQISLAYYSPDFFQSRSRYCNYWKEKLKRVYDDLDSELKLHSEPENEEDGPDLRPKSVARDQQHIILSTLGDYSNYAGSLTSRSYYELIRYSHERYKKRYLEQFELLMGGSFVRQLAAAIGRVRRPVALHLTDEVWGTCDVFKPGNYHLFLDKRKVADALAEPQTWIETPTGNLPTRVLGELPVAISEAGGWLQSLKLSCVPRKCSDVVPPRTSSQRVLERLSDAFRRLEVFEIDYAISLCAYTWAVLSSPRLRYFNMTKGSCRYGIGFRSERLGIEAAYCSVRTRPSIKKFRISDATISQRVMEHICKMISTECEDLWISSVRLDSGRWYKIFEILREKAGPQASDGRCKIHIRGLRGGEFRGLRTMNGGIDGGRELTDYHRKMNQVEDYIKGQDADTWWRR